MTVIIILQGPIEVIGRGTLRWVARTEQKEKDERVVLGILYSSASPLLAYFVCLMGLSWGANTSGGHVENWRISKGLLRASLHTLNGMGGDDERTSDGTDDLARQLSCARDFPLSIAQPQPLCRWLLRCFERR